MDSAREAKLLVISGNNTYLAPDMPAQVDTPKTEDNISKQEQPPDNPPAGKEKEHHILSPSSGELLTISAVDLAEFEPEEFDEVWGAIGKIVMKRGKRLLEQDNK